MNGSLPGLHIIELLNTDELLSLNWKIKKIRKNVSFNICSFDGPGGLHPGCSIH